VWCLSNTVYSTKASVGGGVNREGGWAVVDNGKEAVSQSVMTLIETVRARIQAIRDIPNVTKAQRWHCKDQTRWNIWVGFTNLVCIRKPLHSESQRVLPGELVRKCAVKPSRSYGLQRTVFYCFAEHSAFTLVVWSTYCVQHHIVWFPPI
jgi:hypothetical protein